MPNQLKMKYSPRDIIKLPSQKDVPECGILPRWAHAKLTRHDREIMGGELFYRYESEPPRTQDERDEQLYTFYREYWMEMPLEFMVERGIDWTMHPRYTGDFVEEEEEVVRYHYGVDMEYLEGLVPHQLSTNEEKLIVQLNAIGDFAVCHEGADMSRSVTEVDLELGEKEKFDEANKLVDKEIPGKRTDWIKKAKRAKIGMAVLKAGGRKKEGARVMDWARGKKVPGLSKLKSKSKAGLNFPSKGYGKVRETITDEEKEAISREFAELAVSEPPRDVKNKNGTVSLTPSATLAGGVGYNPESNQHICPPPWIPNRYHRNYNNGVGLLLIPNGDASDPEEWDN